MFSTKLKLLNNLSNTDKLFIEKIIELVLQKERYSNLRNEIHLRRKQIENNEVLTHDEIWR